MIYFLQDERRLIDVLREVGEGDWGRVATRFNIVHSTLRSENQLRKKFYSLRDKWVFDCKTEYEIWMCSA